MDALGEGRFPQSIGSGESRFPQASVLSVAASFVLVFGSLYLLTSTASWSPQRGAQTEASTPSPANGRAETKTPVEVAWAAQAPNPGATQPATQEPVEPIDPASSSAQAQDPFASFGVTPIPKVLAPETETIVPESTGASDASHSPDNLPEIRALPETPAAESADPETPVAADTTATATDQIGQLIARSPPSTLSTQTIQEDIGEDSGDVPDHPVTADAAPSEPADNASASSEATPTTPRSTKPKQESQPARQTAGTAPPSRPTALKQARPAPAQHVQAQPRSGFGFRPPMALAPANNAAPAPVVKPQPGGFRLPKAFAPATKPVPAQAAKPRPSGSAYSRKVWAALAGSKPRAGQRGSATVTFTIGAGGALGGARISRSSGNTRIDQLALATVRRAAPFPTPPSGGASFSIRIDFH